MGKWRVQGSERTSRLFPGGLRGICTWHGRVLERQGPKTGAVRPERAGPQAEPGQGWGWGGAWRQVGGVGWGGAVGTLTRDLEEAGSGAHVVGDAALVAAAAVAGDGVEAQLRVVGGLGGDGDGRRQSQQLPSEAPHSRGDALGAASKQRAAQ